MTFSVERQISTAPILFLNLRNKFRSPLSARQIVCLVIDHYVKFLLKCSSVCKTNLCTLISMLCVCMCRFFLQIALWALHKIDAESSGRHEIKLLLITIVKKYSDINFVELSERAGFEIKIQFRLRGVEK